MGRVEIDTALQLRGYERCASAEGVIAEPEGMARRGGRGRGQSVNVMNGKLGLDNNE